MDSPKSNTYAKYVSKEVAYQSLIQEFYTIVTSDTCDRAMAVTDFAAGTSKLMVRLAARGRLLFA
jgi:hypothetical protein